MGLGRPDGSLILPTSPSTYFLAANRPDAVEAFAFNAQKGLMEKALNDAVVRQSETIVIGASERQRLFVERRLCKRATRKATSVIDFSWNAPVTL
jgi:hypothetical protein